MTDKNRDFEKQKAIIQGMNIMDDDFFVKIAEDVEAMEEILGIFLQENAIHLIWTKSQVHIRNCGTRSVILDALCKSQEGKLYSVEMEKSNRDDHQRRVRYNSSNIDTVCTEKGVDFKDIPELCMIYVSKSDFFKKGYSVYHVNRTVLENGEIVDNGVQEIYVNARIDDGSKVAQLMRYMKNTGVEHPEFPKLSARVKYLKEEQKGVEEMCEAVEKYGRERAKEAQKETAEKLFKNGVGFEVVAECITNLSRRELEKIYKKTVVV